MSSKIKYLIDKAVITAPSYVADPQYEVIMGSVAYGVSTDTSDMDIYAFCIPPKNIIFPHLSGYIDGFGNSPQRFEQYQNHHIKDPDGKGTEYDVTCFGIVKYFDLLMAGNPNITDSIWVPDRCVLHSTDIGRHVRSNRKVFLSKEVYKKYRGYAYSEMHKVEHRKYENGKRKDVVESLGYDPKSLYHVRRLIGECEQILTHGHLNLEADNEALKAIRRGEVSPKEVREWYSNKEKHLDDLMISSDAIPLKPDEEAIKRLLLECLEMRFGNLSDIVVRSDDTYKDVVMNIRQLFKDRGLV